MAVIDSVVATVSFGDKCFFIARYGTDDGQAKQLGPLRNNQANPAGGGMNQQRIASLEGIDAAHQVGRGQPAHGHRGGGMAIDALRQFDQRRSIDDALGTVGAQRIDEAGVSHFVADDHIADAIAKRFDHAGGFNAHTGRHGNRVGAVTKVGVGEIQADCFVAQTHLAGTGLADGYLFHAQNFGSAGLVKAYCCCHFHLLCFIAAVA